MLLSVIGGQVAVNANVVLMFGKGTSTLFGLIVVNTASRARVEAGTYRSSAVAAGNGIDEQLRRPRAPRNLNDID